MCNHPHQSTSEGWVKIQQTILDEDHRVDLLYPLLSEFVVFYETRLGDKTLIQGTAKQIDPTLNEEIRHTLTDLIENVFCKQYFPKRCGFQISVPKEYPNKPLKIIIQSDGGSAYMYQPDGRGAVEVNRWRYPLDKYD